MRIYKMHTKLYSRKHKIRGYLRYVDMDGRMILKNVFKSGV